MSEDARDPRGSDAPAARPDDETGGGPRTSRRVVSIVLLFAIPLLALQVWATMDGARRAEQVVTELRKFNGELPVEKSRQEVTALRIQNQTRAQALNSVLTTLGPTVTMIVALIGALLGLNNYLDSREKDRHDREKDRNDRIEARDKEGRDREKERLDRAATDLREILEHVSSTEARERAVGVVELQHFLTPDKAEYHLRALSALAATARMEEDPEVLRAVRIVVEEAVRSVPLERLAQVSWQAAKLRRVNLRGRALDGLDLRDAILEDADLRECGLARAQLANARMNGAKLDGAVLEGADLAYADLAGASLHGARLGDAALFDAKVLRMDVADADFRGAKFDPERMPWELIRNWRRAQFDDGVMDRLVERFGPMQGGRRILMLMWEIPPLVAGGTWTACYHMVRALRRRGADIVVVVPWDTASILPNPFGAEVEVVPMDIKPPVGAPTAYSPATRPDSWSPYAWMRSEPAWSSYGASSYGASSGPYSRDGVYGRAWSGYGSSYDSYSRGGPGRGSEILRLSEEFARRVARFAATREFDVVHAHDWVTFAAARAAAQARTEARVRTEPQAGPTPWIAHFHSTERERRPLDAAQPDEVLERIEARGARDASHVVTPSLVTARRLQQAYAVEEERITVVPNPLSIEEIDAAQTGRFESNRVVFIGRLTPQKAPDRFAAIASVLHRTVQDAQFWLFGEGEGADRLRYDHDVSLRGTVDWRARGTAYEGASALVLPSRAEPFGMVVLEAMQHRVPVLYPHDSGAAEVLESGIRIDPENAAEVAVVLQRLLTDWRYWEEVVENQTRDVARYLELGPERTLVEVWDRFATDASPDSAPAVSLPPTSETMTVRRPVGPFVGRVP